MFANARGYPPPPHPPPDDPRLVGAEPAAKLDPIILVVNLGAGGIACVTSELADHGGVGADIVLDGAHRVSEPLPPEVLLCAETQERFCFVVPWEARAEACAVFNERFRLGDVYPRAGASVIGRTRKDGTYRVTWNGEAIVEWRHPERIT